MSKLVKVYEPPMCCSSGTCGPTIDENLVEFNNLIDQVAKEGYTVKRFMLTQDAAEFQKEDQVMAVLQSERWETLPITMVGGKVVKQGAYPTYEEIIGIG